MALESWDGLRLGLMALGYQQVIWTHLHCVACGVFKLGVSEELEEYPCPSCGAACKVVVFNPTAGNMECYAFSRG